MAVITGLGPSRRIKLEQKNPGGTTGSGLYWKLDLISAGPGVTIDYKELHSSGDLTADKNLVPWGAKVMKVAEISTTSGYYGDIPVASGTLTVANGIITGYTPA